MTFYLAVAIFILMISMVAVAVSDTTMLNVDSVARR